MGKKQPVDIKVEKHDKAFIDEEIMKMRTYLNRPGTFNTSTEEPINFTLKVRLLVTNEQKDFLDEWINEGRILQNAMVNIVNNTIVTVEAKPEFKELKKLAFSEEADTKTKRDANKKIKEMYKGAGLTEFGMNVLGVQLRKKLQLSPYTDTKVCQQISKKVYSAVDKYLYSNGRALHRKGKNFANSIGYDNVADFRFDPVKYAFLVGAKKVRPSSDKEPTGVIKPPEYTDDIIEYQINAAAHSAFAQEHETAELIPLRLDIEKNVHALKCLMQCLATSDEVKERKAAEVARKKREAELRAAGEDVPKYKKDYARITTARIVREGVGRKRKYFICLGIYGYIPNKFNSVGELKHLIVERGLLGIHIDKSGIYACNGGKLKYFDINGDINTDQMAEKAVKYQRIMSEAQVRCNPDNYEDNGVAKEGEHKWYEDETYKRAHERFNRLCSKRKNIRKERHYAVANQLLELGDSAIVVKTDYSDNMKKQPYKFSPEKEEYRKFVMDCAPASMLSTVEWKLRQYGRTSYEVLEKDLSVTSYNHITDTFDEDIKKESFIMLGDEKVYHGAYIAFLLSHIIGGKAKGVMTKKQERINASLGITEGYTKPQFDKKGIERDFPAFLRTYHNIEIQLGHTLA